jgi:hypothetical protein
MSKVLVSLVLLVKNEANSIEKIIDCAAPAIDRVDLLDTGSTDGTAFIARNTCSKLGITFSLKEKPFVDFATSRNESLQFAEPNAIFALQLSGDEYLEAPEVLRTFCERQRDLSGFGHNNFHVTVRIGDLVWRHPRLVRLGAGWKWYGRVHEAMGYAPDQETKTMTDFVAEIVGEPCQIRHEGYDEARKKTRFYRDLQILQEDIEKNPQDPRLLFYLAQTFEALGAWGDAARLFATRARIPGGWDEEQFVASTRAGRNTLRAGFPAYEALSMFLVAAGMKIHRAEPLMELAQMFLAQNQQGVAYIFASRAASLPFPKNDCFGVEADIYEWRAAYYVALTAGSVQKFEEGEAATRKVLEKDRPGVNREEFEHRLKMYQDELASRSKPVLEQPVEIAKKEELLVAQSG